MQDIDALPKVMGDDGQFHAPEEVVDLSGTQLEGWLAVGLFWVLGLTVFYQFFTRYALNNSASWTEEIARYLLIGLVFVGAAIGVAKNNHIQVDFFYRFMPKGVARLLSGTTDVLRVLFCGAAVILTGWMMSKLGSNSRMSMIDLPMNVVYGVCMLGFALMFYRALQVARLHYQRGYSVLERPETSLQDD